MINHSDPAVQERLQRQARNSTITSLLIALLGMGLLVLLLAFVLLPSMTREVPTIVGYQNASVPENPDVKKKVTPQTQRKPAAPSSAMSRVIVSNSAAPTAVPTVEFEVTEPAVDFGDGADFGAGFGQGTDFGASGGGASFFGQKSSADRIAYVIDFSKSMNDDNRHKLMRKELKQSLDSITGGTQFQVIFFSGPAWVMGDKVD
ncbi:MAG: hypothetical protein ACQKBY_09575, partial [Verrucomicrobiales bacterium]